MSVITTLAGTGIDVIPCDKNHPDAKLFDAIDRLLDAEERYRKRGRKAAASKAYGAAADAVANHACQTVTGQLEKLDILQFNFENLRDEIDAGNCTASDGLDWACDLASEMAELFRETLMAHDRGERHALVGVPRIVI